jgi:hypothetical protein
MESYRQKAGALFTNNGTWSYEGNILKSDDWSDFFSYVDISKPEIPRLHEIWESSWAPPTKDSDARIIVAVDLGYILDRVKR